MKATYKIYDVSGRLQIETDCLPAAISPGTASTIPIREYTSLDRQLIAERWDLSERMEERNA